MLKSRPEVTVNIVAQSLIEKDPQKLSGTPVFAGTRVPVKNLFDYQEGRDSLDHFPTVTREQTRGGLEMYQEWLVAQDEAAA